MASIVWDGFTLGANSVGSSRLRVLSRSGRAAVTGLGSQAPNVTVSDRLAGGGHYGVPTVRPRVVEVPLLQCRDFDVAEAFVASMQPSREPLPLRIEGGPYTDKAVLFVHPEGAAATWDVDALGDREVVHVEGTRWVAPDPTIYDAEPTSFSGSATSGSPFSRSWENPGRGVPPEGLGGRAWTVKLTASGSVSGVWIDQGPGSQRVEFRGRTFTSGTTITVGADRVPAATTTGGSSTPVVAWSRHGGQWVPDPVWPRFRGGVSSLLRIGCTSGSLTVAGELRGTWT